MSEKLLQMPLAAVMARRGKERVRPIVQCRDLTKHFNAVLAVDSIDLEVFEGEFLCLLGPSGCGKTTLLRLITGLETADAGTIAIDNHLMAGPGLHVPPEQRRVGLVFQDYALFPHLNVSQNISFGLVGGSRSKLRVRKLLELVGLDGLESRFPFELSGGQQQRVALARTLANEPRVIALDEPFSNLDAILRKKLREDVRDILKQTKSTVIFVTHDQDEALSLSDRVAVIHAGRILQIDTPWAIYNRPNSRLVAELVGEVSSLPGRITGGQIECELGVFSLDLIPSRQSSQDRLDLVFRPEDLTLTPDPGGPGVVTRLTFLGHHLVATVKLASELQLTVKLGPRSKLKAGERVAVTNTVDPIVFFMNSSENKVI